MTAHLLPLASSLAAQTGMQLAENTDASSSACLCSVYLRMLDWKVICREGSVLIFGPQHLGLD